MDVINSFCADLIKSNKTLHILNPIKELDNKCSVKFRITDKTKFLDLNDNILSFKLIENVRMRFIPIIHIRRLDINNGLFGTFLIDMVSAVVTHIYPRELKYDQHDTILALRNNGEIVQNLQKNLDKLKQIKFPEENTIPQTFSVDAYPFAECSYYIPCPYPIANDKDSISKSLDELN